MKAKNKKKWLIVILAVVLVLALAGTGIFFALRNSGEAVKVAPVSNMNQGGWGGGSEVSEYGMVTTNQNQDIFYDETLTVTQVFVQAGDTVKVGDPLIAYDTTLAMLELEMKQMQIQGIGLQMQTVQEEINRLRATTPVAAGGDEGTMIPLTAETDTKPEDGTGADDSQGGQTPETGKPFPEELRGQTIYSEITSQAKPYDEDKADGSAEKPYHFLCAPGAKMDASFLSAALESKKMFVFETVDSAENPTRILSSWTLDAKSQAEPDPQPPQPPVPTGPTYEELQREIKQKEEQLRTLGLDKRAAELELRKLQMKVSNGVVASTVDGTVKSVLDEETAKMQNSPLISVMGNEGFYISGTVAETALDKVKAGMQIMVSSWETGMQYDATVTGVSISPVNMQFGNNPNVSYYPFTAVVKGDAEFRNGENVNISVDGMTSMNMMSQDIYLDQAFVREEGNQYYVYKKGEKGRLTKQYVEVGKIIYGSLEIRSGLEMEDEIAFPYGKAVKEGAKTESADTLYDYY